MSSTYTQDPSSCAQNNSFFTSRLMCSLRNMSFSTIPQLIGYENYETWAITMEAIWKGQKLFELVVEGKKPEESDTDEEKSAYCELSTIAVNIYILVVNSTILKKSLKLNAPHQMWTTLSTEYRRISNFTLVHQLGSLMTLSSSYDSSSTIGSFIDKYENEYFRVLSLARESSSLS